MSFEMKQNAASDPPAPNRSALPPPRKPLTATSRRSSSTSSAGGAGGGNAGKSNAPAPASFLTKYFLVVLLAFACLSLTLNAHFTHHDTSGSSLGGSNHPHHASYFASVLKDSMASLSRMNPGSKGLMTVDHDDNVHNDGGSDNQDGGGGQHQQLQAEGAGSTATDGGRSDPKLANLNCKPFGGPSDDKITQEMVYWEDIPEDASYVSPFHNMHDTETKHITQYMTFEPDHGGWNNIRMAMETVLVMAVAMGRTLVLPPEKEMYRLGEKHNDQRKHFSFEHFFHMERISEEHVGLQIIPMREFLQRIKDGKVDGIKVELPENGRTEWDGGSPQEINNLFHWLRVNSKVLLWNPEHCLAAFPSSMKQADVDSLVTLPDRVDKWPSWEEFVGKPQPVDGLPIDRLKEMNAERKKLCVYTADLQQQPWVHFPVGVIGQNEGGDGKEESRLLVHFYAFLFFQDWKVDLWMKRFVRDHVRYIDEIQCAAGRVVEQIRARVRQRNPSNTRGDFDSIHVRRGDFQYKVTRFDPPDIIEMLQKKLVNGTTLFIATDERDKSFFKPLRDYYDVVFLDDFIPVLAGINTNYYGMIDQLVASRGRIFYGCWFSTFTGYINRIRGYHTDDHQLPGYEDGVVPDTWYYALKDRFDHMTRFYPVKKSFYAREFPTSWRLIDTGLDASKQLARPLH